MNQSDHLNIQLGTLTAEVSNNGISRLGGVKKAIKLSQGGSCVVIGTQPTQAQIDSTPENVFILGSQIHGSSIFIRHCYPKLLETALSIIETPRTPHLVILGNPGIGKTYFGYVLLLHFARSGATVAYESGKAGCRYLFCVDGIFRDVQAKTILLTYPCHDIWYKFSDGHCTIRYMPTWSHEEIEICREKVFNYLPQTFVESLYDKWGGIPRFVLENARDAAQQRKLENAIAAVELDLLVKAVGNPEASDSVAHRLLHLNVADDFSYIRSLFASEYVTDLVYLKLFETKREELLRFLAFPRGEGAVGVLRNVLFERHANAVIARGGEFQNSIEV